VNYTSARRSTRPSAGPERSQLLQILPSLTVRQFFSVSAYFFLRPTLADAFVRRTPSFSVRQYFSCTNVLLMPRFLYALMFSSTLIICRHLSSAATMFLYILRLYFCVFCQRFYLLCANNLLAPIF
jgi:hypothetical protein